MQKIKQKSKTRDSRTDGKVIVLWNIIVDTFHSCLLETTFGEKLKSMFPIAHDSIKKPSGQSCEVSTFHQKQQQQQQQQQIRTKNEKRPPKVSLSCFDLNDHSFQFYPQTQKLKSIVYLVQINKLHQREVL